MTHHMNLRPAPFALIAAGRKTIELRLYDEKRQQIRVGDPITFSNTDAPEQQLHAIVKELHVFSSFEELYQKLPLEQCGYLPEEIPTASPRDMEAYYPAEKQKQYGVLGIELQLLSALRQSLTD